MLGDIDYNLKPIKPQYFLCKPNREIIGKLSEVFNDSLKTELNSVDEMEFSIPFLIDVKHKLVRNKNVDLIRERYQIKVVKKNKVDWYIVNQITDNVDDDQDIRVVKCYSASHELTDKLIKSYNVESYYCRQVLTDLLANTIWNIDYIDADFDLTYRAFDFSSSTVLEAVFSVAETYNAIVEFNTDSRTISFKKPELFGLNRGLTFSYGKYLKSMNQIVNTDQMVTRLTAKGRDDLTIHKVNPTGQGYIENFGFFMYPFQRDSNKTVLSSSYHMSDSLCHALLDYQELVESKKGLFESHLKQLESFESELNQLEIDLNKLKNNEAVITDTMLTQQFDDKMFFEKYAHSGNTSRTFDLNRSYAYAVMIKVDNTSGVSVALNGQIKSVLSGQWVLLEKVNNTASIQVVLNGGKTGVFMQVANISLSEYSTNGNHAEIIERYSLDNKENQIHLKQIEITNKTNQIHHVKAEISTLQTTLLATNNFTPAQLGELNLFIFEREFNDNTYVDEKDLFAAANEELKRLQHPTLSIDVDIINFLEIIGEQRNWDKLILGDYVNIKYEPTDTNVTARISAIDYDYEGSNINLTLSNTKSVDDESKQFEKFLSNVKNTNIVVDTNKNKWGQAIVDVSEMSRMFENFWNKVTNDINMASNEYVTIDRKGITIIDPNDPLRFLRATHGVLGLTRSGGLRYETAISPDGVIAEMVLGKIILGQRVVIGDTTGVFTIEGSRLMIDDRCGRQVLKLGLLQETPDKFGIFINRYQEPDNCNNTSILNRVSVTADDGFIIERFKNGSFLKTFYTSADGDLFMIGNLRVGEGEQVFIADKNGISVGASAWAAAPFRVDMYGNCWLDSLYADHAEIKNSLFKDGHIRGSDLELRDNKGGMIKMYPENGLWFGTENFDDAIASIAMDGTAKFKKMIVTDGANKLMIDSEAGFIDFRAFDILAGYIEAENIKTDIITAPLGIINDLTVSRLVTKDINDPYGNVINFMKVEGNTHQWITAESSGGTLQASTLDGRPLYYEFGTTDRLTTQPKDKKGNSNTPAMVPDYKYRVKMELKFDGSGASAFPVIQMGQGDNTPLGGKAFIKKPNGEWQFVYHNSNLGQERRLLFKDNGIELSSASGEIAIKHDNGTSITMKNNGEISIVSSGKINVSGSEYVFA